MTIPTHVRSGLVTALLAAFQSAKGTVVDDFEGAEAIRLWTARAPIPAGQVVEGKAFMDSDLGPGISAAYLHPDRPADILRILATPGALEVLLQSNFGDYPDIPTPHFTLATQVSDDRWLTLGFVEDEGGVLGDLIRIRDAWIHRLDLVGQGQMGRLEAFAHFAGRAVLLGDGGVTLPDEPQALSDEAMFPMASVVLRRDPAGANVSLRLRKVRLMLDQQDGEDPHKWDMGQGAYNVRKSGKLAAEIEFESDWSDETRAILALARAGTEQTYRLIATAEDGRILTVNLYNVLMRVDPAGHDGSVYLPFRAVGRARSDGANFVSIDMTPKP